jgi:hypothetical protein
MEQREKLQLVIEQLEDRIAPGVVDSPDRCNNGWGNGENCAPGNSLEHQPKFEDPNTGPSPSNSAASGGGDR